MISHYVAGENNRAVGDYSFAAGRNAHALHKGAFVWAGDSEMEFKSQAENQFYVRATGGVVFKSAEGFNSGVKINPGEGAWLTLSDSTAKRNIRPVDTEDILVKLADLPIGRWSYRAQDGSVEHIGPMAQDFYAAFGVGEDDRHITTIDADGIALAAIQELHKRNQSLEERVAELQLVVERLIDERRE